MGYDFTKMLNDRNSTTTSLEIAKAFDKKHCEVLQKIRALECSDEFYNRNFELSSYVDTNGRSRPMYKITRNGSFFLVMGFKGKKAMKCKIEFMNAFNQLRRSLEGVF